MEKLWFDVVGADGSVTPMGFSFNHACLFGWAGRNKDEVKAHAAELAAHGIRGPKGFPEHFLVSPGLVTQEPDITVVGKKTCGEVEFFFFRKEGVIYVGAGSDHTDRELEGHDMVKSKAICEKPVGKQLWRYDDVKAHWDELRLTSWQVNDAGEEALYQDDTLASLLSLEELLKEAETLYPSIEDVFIWSGTISALNGLVFGGKFSGELTDPVLGRRICFAYHVNTVPSDKD